MLRRVRNCRRYYYYYYSYWSVWHLHDAACRCVVNSPVDMSNGRNVSCADVRGSSLFGRFSLPAAAAVDTIFCFLASASTTYDDEYSFPNHIRWSTAVIMTSTFGIELILIHWLVPWTAFSFQRFLFWSRQSNQCRVIRNDVPFVASEKHIKLTPPVH